MGAARLVPGNKIKALADGGEAMSVRLDMIESARSRIDLQTYSFEADFKDLLLADEKVLDTLGAEGVEACFNPQRLLGHVDTIFDRVFDDS
jgi:adenylosuccinate lyase